MKEAFEKKSTFIGTTFGYFGIRCISFLVTLLSLGLLYPVVTCWKLKWLTRNTIIDNKRLKFDGNATQLFGRYIIWLLLSIITLGLYYIFVMSISIEKWKVKHTHIIGEEDKESEFDGNAIELFGVKFITRFVTIITLGIGSFWAHCYKRRWYAKHTSYDGYKLEFDGQAIEYFGQRIIWIILTVITLGIYYFFLSIKSYKWTISHTKMPAYPDEIRVLMLDGSIKTITEDVNIELTENSEYLKINYDVNLLKQEIKATKKKLVRPISPMLLPQVLLLCGFGFTLILLLLAILFGEAIKVDAIKGIRIGGAGTEIIPLIPTEKFKISYKELINMEPGMKFAYYYVEILPRFFILSYIAMVVISIISIVYMKKHSKENIENKYDKSLLKVYYFFAVIYSISFIFTILFLLTTKKCVDVVNNEATNSDFVIPFVAVGVGAVFYTVAITVGFFIRLSIQLPVLKHKKYIESLKDEHNKGIVDQLIEIDKKIDEILNTPKYKEK